MPAYAAQTTPTPNAAFLPGEFRGPIEFGVPVDGQISAEVFRQVWQFSASAGAVVDISMQARLGDLDPYLSLISPLGDVLISNESASGGLDAGILAYQLPFTGEYRIVARRSGGVNGRTGTTTGSYRLTLELRGGAAADQLSQVILGRQVVGRITDLAPRAVYRLSATGGVAIRAEVGGAARLVVMRVLSPSGTIYAEQIGASPLILPVQLPALGQFLIEISAPRFEAADGADFRLIAYRLGNLPSPRPITYGEQRSAQHTDRQAWFFFGNAGDLVRFTVRPEGAVSVESSLNFGEAGEVPIFQAEIGTGLSEMFDLPSNGVYQVEIAPQSGTTARYSLLLEHLGSNSTAFERFALNADQAALRLNGPIEGELTRGERVSYWLDASAGDVIALRAVPRSAQDQLGVRVYAPDGTPIETSISLVDAPATLRNVVLTNSGRYRITVFDANPHRAGETEQPLSYTLTAQAASGGVLTSNQPVKGVVSPADSMAEWDIPLIGGSILNARLTNLTPQAWSPLMVVLDPNNRLIASSSQVEGENEPSTATEITLYGVQASETGTYRVIVAGRISGQVGAGYAAYRLNVDSGQPFEATLNQTVRTTPLTGLNPPTRYNIPFTPPPGPRPVAEVLAPLIPPAQIANELLGNLAFGTTARGVLPQGSLAQGWRINSGANVLIQLRAESVGDDRAPSLALWDRRGILVANQMTQEGGVSTLTYRSTGGEYTLVVSMGVSGGRYLLSLDSESLSDSAFQATDGTPLTYGQTIFGEILRGGEVDTYFFAGTLNQSISVQVTRANGLFLPQLELFSPNGRLVAATEATSRNANAALTDVRLPASGIYRLRMTNYNRIEPSRGRYALYLGESTPSRVRTSGGGILTDNQAVQGALGAGDSEDTWLFRAQRGESATLTLTSLGGRSPLPLRLELLDSNGVPFASQSVALVEPVVRLSDVRLSETGVYRARVSGGNQTAGLYSLRLDLTGDDKPIKTVRYGETVSGIINSSRPFETWVFSGTAGDVISIGLRFLRGDRFAASFQLRAANGVALATVADLDGAGGRADVLLPFSGAYTIVVANPAPSFRGTGVYALSLGLSDSRARYLSDVIHYGETVEGVISADDPTDTWVFAAKAGERLRIVAQAADSFLAPAVQLATPYDQVLLEALPDSSFAPTARIGGSPSEDFIVPADGVYVISVRGAPTLDPNTPSSGKYRLTLDYTPAPIAEIDQLGYGNTANGVLAGDRPSEAYRFRGQRGDTINVEAVRESGANVGLVLLLLDAENRLLASIDSDDQDTAALNGFRLPETGEYQLIVTRFRGAVGKTEGRYTIRLDGSAEARPVREVVEFGQRVIGRLNDATPLDRFGFDAEAGDVIGITTRATSGDLDLRLSLETLDGEILAVRDDESGTNALLSGFQVPRKGRYVITLARVGSQSVGSAGNYEMFVNRLYQIANAPLLGVPIGYGAREIGALDEFTTNTSYLFSAAMGDQISIEVLHQSDDAPPILTLRDPLGTVLAESTRQVGRTAIETFAVPSNGIYQIEVRRPLNARSAFTPYAITVRLLSAKTMGDSRGGILGEAETVTGMLQGEQTTQYWLFSGQAREKLQINLLWLGGPEQIEALLFSPSGQLLSTTAVSAIAAEARSNEVSLPADGIYTVLVIAQNNPEISRYRLSLLRQGQERTSQPADTLTPGFAASGALNDVMPSQAWTFTTRGQEVFAVRALATTGDLSPRLTLVGPSGAPLAESIPERDALGNSASIAPTLLLEAGTYTLIIGRERTGTVGGIGGYRLVMELGESALTPSSDAVAAQRTNYGQPIHGVLQREISQSWAFIGAAGDAVNLSVRGTQAPRLQLRDISGALLAEAIGAEGESESTLNGLILPNNGRYIITVSAAQITPYTLIVTRDQSAFPSDVTRVTPRILPFNIPQQNGITPGNAINYWTFNGQQGTAIEIITERINGDLQPAFALFTSSGKYVGGAALGVATLNVVLPEDGTYLLAVSRWLGTGGTTNGAYRLRLNTISSAQLTLERQFTYNQPYFGAFDTLGTQTWSFLGQGGDTLDLSAVRVSGDMVGRFQVTAPNGSPLFNELFFGADDAVARQVSLPQSGKYTVTVEARSGSGVYRLLLERRQTALDIPLTAPIGIGYGESRESTLATGEKAATWVFVGRAGDRMVASISAGGFAPSVRLLTPSGEIVAEDEGGRARTTARLTDVILPRDGIYFLLVSDRTTRADSVRGYELTLIRSTPGAAFLGNLAPNQAVQATLSRDQVIHEWRVKLPGTPAKRIAISIEGQSADLEIYVLILREGEVVARAERVGNRWVADAEWRPSMDYRIVVAAEDANRGGRYELLLTFVP
ncbi:MAG: hypothetical protein OHK0023_18920 [Anaerolineae bacterium]